MKYLIFILLFFSCSNLYICKETCVPKAANIAWAYEQETGLPARISLYHTNDPHIDHAQAFGFDGEKWIPLNKIGNRIVEGNPESNFKPYKYLDLSHLLKDHLILMEKKKWQMK